MIENYDEIIEQSRHSMMVRHVCPVGNLLRRETTTPHGWAQLIDLERKGLASWTDEAVDVLYKCADCGSCRANSVYDIALPAAIAAERASVVEKELAPPVVYELAERFGEWENPYEQEAPEAPEGQGDDALFVGDEALYLRPQVVEAALKLLKAVGVEPVLVGRGRSSGYLPCSLGLPDVAGRLARTNLDELKDVGAGRLFVLSPGDFFVFGQMNEERLGWAFPRTSSWSRSCRFWRAGWRKAPSSYARRTRARPRSPTSTPPTPSACRSGTRPRAASSKPCCRRRPVRSSGATDAPIPCGNLALQFTQPRLADALTQARLDDAVKAGASGVITEDAGSLAHLERHALASGVRVEGLYELLADHLDS